MKDDQRKALLIVGALLAGASSTGGFVGGRMSVETPPAEVRLVRLPPRVVRLPAAPVEPAADLAAEPVPFLPPPVTPVEPEPPVSALPAAPSVEPQSLPPPRPKVEAKPKPESKPQPKAQARPQPKPEKAPPARKPRHPSSAALPSCAAIKREYEAMSWSERMAAYHRASADEIAHGKRCLGF